jgi:GNAT superfamily N-acetyltransferase
VSEVAFRPLDGSTWPDLVRLFESQREARTCWCQYWRHGKDEHDASGPEANRRRLRALADAGAPLGILAYREGRAIGWCSVAPRPTHGRIGESPSFGPAGDDGTWSVTCFVVLASERRTGLTLELLREAVASARANGARIVEGYPVLRHVREDGSPIGAPFRYMGDASIYRRAGFTDVATPGRVRRIMRLDLSEDQTRRRSVAQRVSS